MKKLTLKKFKTLKRSEMKEINGGSYHPDHICNVCYRRMWHWWCDLSYSC
ncbi:hypothetical protein [Flavobacterium piscis]|uniref:Natural product n=1 Tax=Flavobacterium piscis TaxID=1114874 RepID=A0ABU1Y458_9FLAO|nr:natural product precursor [Flavobacterium piscis]